MKRRTLLALAIALILLLLTVPGSPAFAGPPNPGLLRLQRDAKGEIEITFRAESNWPSFIRGHMPLPPTASKAELDAAGAAFAFLEHYADAFGAETISDELEVLRTQVDALGMSHVTLRQVYQGVEVYSAQIKVHLSADGSEVVALSSGFVAGIVLPSVEPQIIPDEAITAAKRALPGGELFSEPKLVVYPEAFSSPSSALAWLIELWDGSLPARNVYVVDAQDGAILAVLNRLYHARDRQTYTANNTSSLPGTLARSEGDGPIGDQDVDNAHDFSGLTYDYYHNTHGRDSYDDQGATIVSTAHYRQNFRNAFWNGTQTVYGDGFTVLDVVAHELTHAVTEHSAALEYVWQSGALNESVSDIFGAMVDRDDWLMGEDLPTEVLGNKDAFRDLSNPARLGQPAHTDDWVITCFDSEGVHTNSGIPNKAYYNVATAIGRDRAELIFYRTLIVYLQPTSSLEDARAGALQAAQDLYGSGNDEYRAVQDGFLAVGLDGMWQPLGRCIPCNANALIDAINTANSDGEADTLFLEEGCTYRLSVVNNDIHGPNGLPSITSQITIQGNGAMIERSDTAPEFRIFHVAAEGNLTLNELTVGNGVASGGSLGNNGGGISNWGTASLHNSTVRDNRCIWGGGGVANAGTLELVNSTITHNSAGDLGGGIANATGGVVDLINSTVTQNSAGSGGGMWIVNTVRMVNTIVADQLLGTDCAGPDAIASNGHNLDSDRSCNLTAPADLPGRDPLLGPLQDNGGPTETHALLPGSPAIDAGDESACQPTDQRGVLRPRDGNGDGIATCDLGAYEAVQSILVTTNVPRVSPGDGLCSLIEAINEAQTPSFASASGDCRAGCSALDTIELVAPGPYVLTAVADPTDGGSGLPIIASGIRIEGKGATIERSSTAGTPSFRIFYVTAGGRLVLNELTLRNGLVSGAFDIGGGICNQWGSVELTDSTITNNSASFQGGGIYSYRGALMLNNSTVNDNSAGQDGGGILNRSNLSLINSTVSGNNAGQAGGGIANGDDGNLALVNGTISDNRAIQGGGLACLHYDVRIDLTNTIVANNPSGGDCSGASLFTSKGHNLDSDGSCNLVQATDKPNTDPLIDELKDHGGPTETHGLFASSPAIDAIPAALCPATDQRGVSRPQGDDCDIGAFEFGEITSRCEIDLVNNTHTCSGVAAITFVREPINGEAVLKIDLDPHRFGSTRAVFETFFGTPPSDWTVNIGDSATNNGAGGDAGTQYNDAELHIQGTTMEVYGNDGIADDVPLLSVPGLVSSGSLVSLEISNERLDWDNHSGEAGHLVSPYLYALNGQPDSEGPVNYDIYAAFNRTIGAAWRNGSGVTHVAITLLSEPTAIDLLYFTAQAGADHVTLAWVTGTEVETAGFNLWRSEATEGPFTQINEVLIPAEGDALSGASYTYTDSDVVKGITYYYKLEDVDIYGVGTFHEPVWATLGQTHGIYLPLVVK